MVPALNAMLLVFGGPEAISDRLAFTEGLLKKNPCKNAAFPL